MDPPASEEGDVEVPNDKGDWIRRFQRAPQGATRLVCFPHAGGSASHYLGLARLLADHLDVLSLQYPGRQDRRNEPCVAQIGEMAERICDVVDESIDSPYAFFGHSMGAILAFEVARRLPGRGLPPPLWLFASGRRAPSTPRDETVHLRDDAGMIAELRLLGGTNRSFLDDDELLAMILPATRQDYRAIETYSYVPGPPLGCPITAIVGDADPRTTLAEASAWQAHTAHDFDLRVLAGGHFFLDAHLPELAELINDRLARCIGSHAGEKGASGLSGDV